MVVRRGTDKYPSAAEVVDDPEVERALLLRSAAGDARAFNPVVAAYTSQAYHYAYAILHNHHDAMDAAQDAFVKAYGALARFDTARSFFPWYRRILRNRCLDMIARGKRRPERPGYDDPDETMRVIPSATRAPGAKVMSEEDAARIRRAMDELSPEHGEVLHLRHYEDMSYEEIAETLDIPTGTVMSRLFHARRKLAERMKST